MSTKWDNSDWSRIARDYGVTAVEIDDEGTGQGNEGVSLPCRGCYVQSREGQSNRVIKMSIGVPASATRGVALGRSQDRGATFLWVPVSDVSQLYFYGEYCSVDIMYFFG